MNIVGDIFQVLHVCPIEKEDSKQTAVHFIVHFFGYKLHKQIQRQSYLMSMLRKAIKSLCSKFSTEMRNTSSTPYNQANNNYMYHSSCQNSHAYNNI